jgi:hypothetical protein
MQSTEQRAVELSASTMAGERRIARWVALGLAISFMGWLPILVFELNSVRREVGSRITDRRMLSNVLDRGEDALSFSVVSVALIDQDTVITCRLDRKPQMREDICFMRPLTPIGVQYFNDDGEQLGSMEWTWTDGIDGRFRSEVTDQCSFQIRVPRPLGAKALIVQLGGTTVRSVLMAIPIQP